jgi:hypothetical protein
MISSCTLPISAASNPNAHTEQYYCTTGYYMVLLCQWLCHLCGELWYHTRAEGFTYVSFTHTGKTTVNHISKQTTLQKQQITCIRCKKQSVAQSRSTAQTKAKTMTNHRKTTTATRCYVAYFCSFHSGVIHVGLLNYLLFMCNR